MAHFDRREFLKRAGMAGLATTFAAGLPRPAAAVDETLAPFLHGVASGDPTDGSVVLWTRWTPPAGSTSARTLHWTVASALSADGTALAGTLLASGTAVAAPDRDFCVKVDATGLPSGTTVYYRFEDPTTGEASIVGRTKTAPAPDADVAVRFGVVSCSSMQHGLFNVYDAISNRWNDLDAIVHLGDYLYEYPPVADGGYGDPNAAELGRVHQPPEEMTTLAGYRTRHHQYKLDPDLRRLHQLFPFITTWDDHESTNNSWREGANNHTEGDEGAWADRKGYAFQAYDEWMPIRVTPTKTATSAAFVPAASAFGGTRPAGGGAEADLGAIPAGHLQVWRSLRYGANAEIIVMDTRLERDEEVAQMGFTVYDDTADDESRIMVSQAQRDFVTARLGATGAAEPTFKLLAQQVIMSPWNAGGLPELLPYLAEQGGQDRPNLFIKDQGNALNPDQWDGYTAERRRLLDMFRDDPATSDVVVLTGDVHTTWAIDLTDDPHNPLVYNPVTGDGAIGAELVCPGVTSPGLFHSAAGAAPSGEHLPEELAALVPVVEEANKAGNPHVKYFDGEYRGYIVIEVDATAVEAEFFHLDTILSTDYVESNVAAYQVKLGDRHLTTATVGSVVPGAGPAAPAGGLPRAQELAADAGTSPLDDVFGIETARSSGGGTLPATGGGAMPTAAIGAAALAGLGLALRRRSTGPAALDLGEP